MEIAANLISSALAPSTLTAYLSSFDTYRTFCHTRGVRPDDFLPPNAGVILAFASQLFLEGKKAGSANKTLTAIRSVCRALGVSTAGLQSKQLDLFMRGYKKLLPSVKRVPREPAVYAVLSRWCAYLNRFRSSTGTALSSSVAKALLVSMFHGFLRPGESTSGSENSSSPPLRSHLSFHSDHVLLFLPESKTDIFRAGVTIRIAANGSPLCPVALLNRMWRAARDQRSSAPLFQNGDGSAVSYAQLALLIRHCCLGAGLDPAKYKPHSLRIGAATTAACLGFPASVIKVLGRWSSLCYQVYTRMTPARFLEVSKAFAESSAVTLSPSRFGALRATPSTDISFENLHVLFASTCARGPALEEL